jgi:crossover junction endodeoxyribonuclease RuvC
LTLILGIDPGSRITGYGIIQADKSSHRYVTSGCIRLKSDKAADNLQKIFEALGQIIHKFSPEESAIEQIFMHRNPGSAIKLGQARGVAMVAAANHGLIVAEYSARQIKQSVVGYGAAKKEQIQHMVCQLLQLSGTPQVDAADALAVAICHANSRQGIASHISLKGRRRGRMR